MEKPSRMGEWVLVENGMPKDGIEVLTFSPDGPEHIGDIEGCYELAFRDEGNWSSSIEGVWIEDRVITQWMYLFPHPQSESEYSAALKSILLERTAQDAKWGEQNHNPFVYLAILMEEVGELSQAALQTRFGGEHGGLRHLREEAVQTAAVAMAIVECLDRRKWNWNRESRQDEGSIE